jgi:hypothetical protein
MKNYFKKYWKKAMIIIVLSIFIGDSLGILAANAMNHNANQAVVEMFKDGYTVDEFDAHPTYITVKGHKNNYTDWKVVKVYWYCLADVTEGHHVN